ncbi:MAG TPA: hypothetical protein VGF77_13340 [Allosphingosinicella sp.]
MAALAGPAIAAPPTSGRTLWDRRLHEYRRLQALDDASNAFGPYSLAKEEYDLVCLRLGVPDTARWSSESLSEADRKEFHEAGRTMDRKCDVYMDAYYCPAQDAAIALLLTPAPDLEAALTKIAIIKQHDLHTLTRVPRDCFEVVAEDMARLRGRAFA